MANTKSSSLVLLLVVTLTIINNPDEISAYGGAYYPGTPPLDIIAIEGINDGLFVTTGDTYYSIVSELLAKIQWESVTVNGNQVFVSTSNNKTFTTNLNLLSEEQRDLILEIKQENLINLNGLGQLLSAQKNSIAPSIYGNNQVNSYASNSYGNGDSFSGPVSLASQAASDLLSGNTNYNYNGRQSSRLSSGGFGSVSAASYASGLASSASGVSYGSISSPLSANSYYQNSAPSSPISYNYYNLGQLKELRKSLSGDVYSFSLSGFIVDVFSSTALVSQNSGQSILYRDHRYFSYATQYMALGINRIFLTKHTVIFVYNDGSVLAKSSWMLNTTELDLVIEARNKIKELTAAIATAADISEKSSGKSSKHAHNHLKKMVKPVKPHKAIKEMGDGLKDMGKHEQKEAKEIGKKA